MSAPVKILIIGPTQSGKTTIANYLAEKTETITKNYRPTKAVRILEFERDAPHHPKKPGADKALIELWDGNT